MMKVYSCGAAVLALVAGSIGGCGGATDGGQGSDSGGAEVPDSGHVGQPPPGHDAGPAPDTGATDAHPHPTDSGTTADASEAGTMDAGDHGAPSMTYPAFMPDVAQVVDNGGPTLAHPVVVSVTWSADPSAAMFNTFGDTIGGSTYWSDVNSEYGVGPAVSGASNHVSITTTPPAMLSDQDLVNLVTTNAGNPASGWPAPTSGTIYTVYMAPTTSLTMGGQDACMQGIGGYHDEAMVGGTRVAYAIVPQCPGSMPSDALQGASHELDEAATDPYPGSANAYSGFDADHLSYEFFNQFQDEVGDACEFFSSSYYTDAEPTFMFPVQRQWSNLSARQGHNPCVPVMSEPFYNVTLFKNQEQAISVDLSVVMAGIVHTKGFKGTLNQPLTFQVGYFSDAATSGPWALSASVDAQLGLTDNSGNPINNGTAAVTIDKTTGVNGEKAYVTVTPTAWSSLGIVYVAFTSNLPGAQAHHYQPVLISKM